MKTVLIAMLVLMVTIASALGTPVNSEAYASIDVGMNDVYATGSASTNGASVETTVDANRGSVDLNVMAGKMVTEDGNIRFAQSSLDIDAFWSDINMEADADGKHNSVASADLEANTIGVVEGGSFAIVDNEGIGTGVELNADLMIGTATGEASTEKGAAYAGVTGDSTSDLVNEILDGIIKAISGVIYNPQPVTE